MSQTRDPSSPPPIPPRPPKKQSVTGDQGISSPGSDKALGPQTVKMVTPVGAKEQKEAEEKAKVAAEKIEDPAAELARKVDEQWNRIEAAYALLQKFIDTQSGIMNKQAKESIEKIKDEMYTHVAGQDVFKKTIEDYKTLLPKDGGQGAAILYHSKIESQLNALSETMNNLHQQAFDTFSGSTKKPTNSSGLFDPSYLKAVGRAAELLNPRNLDKWMHSKEGEQILAPRKNK